MYNLHQVYLRATYLSLFIIVIIVIIIYEFLVRLLQLNIGALHESDKTLKRKV